MWRRLKVNQIRGRRRKASWVGGSERIVGEVKSRKRKRIGGRVEGASGRGCNGEVRGKGREGFGRNGKR